MKKSTKIALGIGTVWPILYMFIFIIFIFSMVLFLPSGETSSTSGPPVWFFAIFPIHFLTILWIWVLVIIYIVDVFRNDRVPKDKQVLWLIVILLGGIIAMPIYWYLYIWREPELQ